MGPIVDDYLKILIYAKRINEMNNFLGDALYLCRSNI